MHQIGGHVYDQMHFNQLLARKRDAGMLKDLVLARMVRLDSKLISFLPELGNKNYSGNELSAMVGIAPYARDSGNKHEDSLEKAERYHEMHYIWQY